MLRCPVHRCPTPGGECPICQERGLRVVECEVDKIERVSSTMEQQGQSRSRFSYAVLIFYPAQQDDPLDNKGLDTRFSGG